MGFYLAFPFLIRSFESTWPWKLAACFIASSAIGLLASRLGLPFYSGGKDAVVQGLVMVNPVARIFEFCLGMTAALLWSRSRNDLAHFRFGTWAAIELIGVLLLIWGAHWINMILQPFMHSGAMQYWTAQTLSPVAPAALLLVILASSTGPLAKVLACRPVRFLGEISFSIYLTHQLVIRFFVGHPQILDGLSRPTKIGVFLITMFAASTALHLVEGPARKMILRCFGRTVMTKAATVDDHSLVSHNQI